MTSVVLCSTSGAPGVTTAALALTAVWPQVTEGRRAMLVDADPAGSGLIGGAVDVDVARAAGALALAADTAAPTVDRLLEFAVALDVDASRWMLPGISDPAQARSLPPVWSSLLDLAVDLHLSSIDLVIDAGRLGHRDEPNELVTGADAAAILLEPTLTSSVVVAAAVRRLTTARVPRSAPVPVVVGEGRPYSAREVERALGVDVAALAFDPRAAAALGAGDLLTGRLERSALLRSARTLARDLLAASPAGVVA